MLLHLVRHTKPLIAEGICYGQSDVAVSLSESRHLAAVLQQTLPLDVPVYTSTLQRCAIPARLLHPAAKLDPRLMEFNFGSWELCRWEQIPRLEIDAWAQDAAGYQPGGAENLLQMIARIRTFIAELEAQAVTEAILICHAGVMKILSCWHATDDTAIAQAVIAARQTFPYGSTLKIVL